VSSSDTAPALRGGTLRVAVVDSHPIQYHVPWFRELDQRCELQVLYAHAQTAEGQARAGYGVSFDWDVDLSSGFRARMLRNVARDPGVHRFAGCDTPELFSLLAPERFDAVIVTGWYLKCFWQAVLACKRNGVPVLVRGDSQLTAQSDRLRRGAKQLLYPLLLRSFDGFLSVGARNRAYLERYHVPAARIFHVPHVVDVERFAQQAALARASREHARAELAAGEGDRIALSVGRLVPFKRCEDVIDAIAALGERGKHWIAAYAGAGPSSHELEQRARKLGVRVALLGFRNQSQLARVYDAADALVLASEARETWGLVVNEAMASGLPAIVSDAAGCAPDMIDEGKTGFSYRCGDIPALADRLERSRSLRSDPAVQQALAEQSRRHGPAHAAALTLEALHAVLRARGAKS
jgi:glycosyltransferase involved in cell wall biosynthesis